MKKLSYSSELTEEQFNKYIVKFLPKVKENRGRPKIYSDLEKFNACMYVLKTGCQWRMLPNKYPPYRTVHKYYRRLCIWCKLERIIANLNRKLEEKATKKHKQTIVAPDLILITDSKTIRSSEYFERTSYGIDGHKKIKGIKLCPILDRMKRCWRVVGTSANTSEYVGVTKATECALNSKIRPNSKIIIGDRYFDAKPLRQLFKQRFNLDFVSLQRNPKRKFNLKEDQELQKYQEKQKRAIVCPWRWIVEQFFAHLEKARRLVMIWDRKLSSYLGFVKLRIIQLVIKRIERLGN